MDRRWWTMAAIPAALAWTAACTHSGPSQPDAPPSEPRPDALSLLDVSSSAGCIDPRQLDTEPAPPPPTFEVTGCLWHTLDTGKALAVFTWNNRTDQELVAPYGPLNQVSPGAAAQGQPTSFASDYVDRFAVPFDGALATWSVLGQSVTVSSTSPDCASCSYYQTLGCLDCTGFWVDTCTTACGDGVCDDVETCASCPADCDCSSLRPLVDCVLPLAGGKKVASFGYSNGAATGGGLPIGPANQFLAAQPARGQPVRFETGEHHSVFQVTYDGPDLTWTLAGNTVTVSADAPLCPQGCASSCPAGTTCVAAQCLAACGDGVCHWESCGSCPGDCACTGDGVCLGTACQYPPRCGGGGPECGVVRLGILKTDCGPCPDGQGCHNEICVPVCR